MTDKPMVFVFGSNKAGIHGAGAALFAKKHHGAVQGVGEGMTGNSYAIPTKGRRIENLPWSEITPAVQRFVNHARENPHQIFMLTPVGCGLAGHSRTQLWKTLRETGLPDNVVLSASWISDGVVR